jgi:hypothetical protein
LSADSMLYYLFLAPIILTWYTCSTIYIYDPCCGEIWRFFYPKKSYFSRAKPERNMTSEGKHKCIITAELYCLKKSAHIPL